jgi:hypothetical protein
MKNSEIAKVFEDIADFLELNWLASEGYKMASCKTYLLRTCSHADVYRTPIILLHPETLPF